jgi:protein-S-isoprenylcysteine O-methyltransferase Ste14
MRKPMNRMHSLCDNARPRATRLVKEVSQFINSAGHWLFRFRSFTPIPIGMLCVFFTWRGHVFPGLGGESVDAALNGVGVVFCVLGALWRFLVVASVAPGSVGPSKKFGVNTLETGGFYGSLRHPLYFGNIFIVKGLLLIANEPLIYVLGLGFLLLHLFFVVRSEEAFLHHRFGELFAEWKSKTPAFLLRSIPKVKFINISGALHRELNVLASWGSLVLLLLMWEYFARSELTRGLARGLWSGIGALLVLAALNKVFKLLKRSS